MINIYSIIAMLLVFFLGAAIGSFSLVTVMRGHRKENWVKGRSACESCGKELHWWELIPTVSFLILGGKCSKCKAKIDPTHFVSETGLGLLYVAILVGWLISYLSGIQAIGYLIATTILWKNVMSDLLYYEVSSIDTYIAAIVVSILNGCWISTLIMIAISIVLLSSDNFKMFGAGDFDIAILIYAALGRAIPMVNVMFFASLLALVVYVLVIRKTEEKHIPFVPFLFAGFVLTACGCGLI